MSIIEIDNVSMRFNLSKERHESFKEYFLALAKGHLQLCNPHFCGYSLQHQCY